MSALSCSVEKYLIDGAPIGPLTTIFPLIESVLSPLTLVILGPARFSNLCVKPNEALAYLSILSNMFSLNTWFGEPDPWLKW